MSTERMMMRRAVIAMVVGLVALGAAIPAAAEEPGSSDAGASAVPTADAGQAAADSSDEPEPTDEPKPPPSLVPDPLTELDPIDDPDGVEWTIIVDGGLTQNIDPGVGSTSGGTADLGVEWTLRAGSDHGSERTGATVDRGASNDLDGVEWTRH